MLQGFLFLILNSYVNFVKISQILDRKQRLSDFHFLSNPF
jgi:hypothetical protein